MSRLLLVSVLSVLVACSSALCAATVALAQDGVRVDPDSPPGVEYALPLQTARDQARGTAPAADPSRSSQAPLFGSGITARGSADQPPSRAGSERRQRKPGSSGASAERRRPVAPDPSVLSSADEAAGSSIVFSLIGAVAVLLAGGLIALSLRRQRPTG